MTQPIQPFTPQEIVNNYGWMMQDVKQRLKLIREINMRTRTLGTNLYDIETCCLNFRKILEIIAMANMISNQDEYLAAYNNFASHWNAKKIIAFLENVNPNFYPTPIQVNVSSQIDRWDDINNGSLTKEEFIEIYNDTSPVLHTRNPFTPPPDQAYFQAYIVKFKAWHDKIMLLLQNHSIELQSGNLLIVQLDNEEGHARVNWFALES